MFALLSNSRRAAAASGTEIVFTLPNPDIAPAVHTEILQYTDANKLKILLYLEWQAGKNIFVKLTGTEGQQLDKDAKTGFITDITNKFVGVKAEDPLPVIIPTGSTPNPSITGGPADDADCPPAEDSYKTFDPKFTLDPAMQAIFDAKIQTKFRAKNKVKVFILDTSPYGNAPETLAGDLKQYKDKALPFASRFYKDAASSVIELEASERATRGYIASNDEMSCHGIFVASIILSIVPDAEVKVIPVMGRNGRAGLPELEWEIEKLAADKPEDNTEILINLSATVVDSTQEVIVKTLLPGLMTDTEKAGIAATYNVPVSTRQVIADFSGSDHHRIIAAAGNDGIDAQDKPWPGFPARLENVLSVGAVDRAGLPTDYTNLCAIPTDSLSPAARAQLSVDEGEPHGLYVWGGVRRLGVFGLYMLHDFTGIGDDCTSQNFGGVAQWAGTSFATAIATGYMAYLCSQGMTAKEAFDTLVNLPTPNVPGGAPTLFVTQG